jgi:hypothetical protein
MGSIPRLKSFSEFDEIRKKLAVLKCPTTIIETHITALKKAYSVRVKNRADRKRRMEQRYRKPVINSGTLGPRRKVNGHTHQDW